MIDSISPLLSQLENQRQEAIEKRSKGFMSIAGAGVVSFLVGGIIASASGEGGAGLITGVLLFVVSYVVVHNVFIGKYKAEYLRDYKLRVLSEVARKVQPGMEYQPSQGISQSLFKSTGLVSSRIDRYHSEDLFTGHVGETEVWFSEVKAERKDTKRDSEGNTRTTWKTLFDGVFFMADFHKEFSTWATVTPDFAERNFGWLGKKLQKLGGDVVHLENPEFEKAFVVRGGDQVAVRYILTPDMQDRLLSLRAALGDSVMLAFKDSKVVMLFSTQSNWFEPDFGKASNDLGQLENFVLEMNACCDVVEMMNLNTRIWTKE
ncbi:DUF3137 domain-containing protein [Rubritalea tangerina]|uniref:DUF3137 domain-containing protein n=1 Tax=Rubritalea tangerina TaxID=430798 RepID=A0ABW4ZC78_9BACT